MNEELFHQLLDRYLTGRLQEEERLQLVEMLKRQEYMSLLETAMKESFSTNAYEGPPSRERSAQMKAWLLSQMAGEEQKAAGKASVSNIRLLRRWSWAAAAAVIVLAVGTFFWLTRSSKLNVNTVQERSIADIEPGLRKAILTLSNGSTITLDSMGNRVIQQGQTTISQHGGKLQYDVQGSAAPVGYNTLATPRGGQFTLTLPDGTKVWLNAASSIYYPTAFTGDNRTVKITGEAYFEVTKDAKKPFRVNIDGKAELQVLGTSFNINAYQNEAGIKTTLIEGSVNINAHKQTKILSPGQQAQVTGSENIKVIDNADIEKAVAWKDGYFNFNDADLHEVMRQLERWYDITVVYAHPVRPVKFNGALPMNLTLSQILKILERMQVKFTLGKDRKLIIEP